VNKIRVIGIGFRPLDKEASDIVRSADVVLANNRLLDVFKKYTEYADAADKLIVHPGVYETIDYIGDNYKTKQLVLLAAGDPMFFGIGRLVIERFGRNEVEIFPDLSSVQVAFSRIRETSNNALLISFHGGPDPEKRRRLEYGISELPGLIEKHKKIAVLTDKVNSPDKIAETILEQSAVSDQRSAVKIYVCEKIGYEDERVIEGTPEEIHLQTFEHPNVVIIIQSTEHSTQNTDKKKLSAVKFGLKEAEIAHSKGLITKDEVRAVTLHKLRLPEKGVLWDIGAGSGSVSIEASRVCPGLKIFAVEKKEEQLHYINGNKASFHANNIKTVKGDAPDVLEDLPGPDRVFIGGSGDNLTDIVNFVSDNMKSGITVINATTIETLNEAVHCLEQNSFNIDISEVSVSRSKIVKQKRHMSALNPIFIITGEKPPC
jgi:precorrin-6Y C5,15-methyltransferase (decarboxylating)